MLINDQLLTHAQRGDRKAQYNLYRQCFPLLMSVSIRYKLDEQEAVSAVNMGYLKILNNLEKYRTEVPFAAWIRRIMINSLIDEFRHERKWREVTYFSDTIETESTEVPLDWNEADLRFDAEQLEALLRRLPPVSQQVFNLFALDGYSHQEISEMLGMSVGTSKWHVSFARKQMQTWIKNQPSIV